MRRRGRFPVDRIRDDLTAWYRRSARDLPWRRTRDPYAIWVSETMLQQTQVATVIPYFERFMERFPTLRSLADAPLPEVLQHWSGLGYYSRARNLHRAAQVAAHELGGLPHTSSELEQLPGFGPYTSGAVASIAFDEPVAAVDGNVIRVLARIAAIPGPRDSTALKARVAKLAQRLVEGSVPSVLNQSLMELGALVCTPRSPGCASCPVSARCTAHAMGRAASYPGEKRRVRRQPLDLTAAVVIRRDEVLLARRPESGLFGGLWELPSVEGGPEELSRAIGVKAGSSIGSVYRTLSHRDLSVDLRRCRCPSKARLAKTWLGDYSATRWVALQEFAPQARGPVRSPAGLGMSSASRACLEKVYRHRMLGG